MTSVLPPTGGLADARSWLFVPGDRPERFPKAKASGADVIILDLEDAVAPPRKDFARSCASAWLTEHPGSVLRINASGTPWFEEDLAVAAAHGCPVMVPKATNEMMDLVAAVSPTSHQVALIESAQGVLSAADICAHPSVVRAAFGNLDLAADLGVEPQSQAALTTAKSMIVLASAAAGLPGPIDGVHPDPHHTSGLASETTRAKELGYTAKLCIHPSQLATVHDVMAPTPDAVAWARAVLDGGTSAGATMVHGSMVDEPVRRRAARILASTTALMTFVDSRTVRPSDQTQAETGATS